MRTLDNWLLDEKIPGIYGVDTRHLTKKLRTHGVMLGIIRLFEDEREIEIVSVLNDVSKIPDPNLTDLVRQVSVKTPVKYEASGNQTVVLIDCGVKYSIIRNLLKRGINVVRVPYNFSAKEVMEYNPNGVFLSNGPGDPKNCTKTIKCIEELVEKIPLMGIYLGAQILTLAMGGDTYKLKYGHRSQNQPAFDLNNKRCYITTQNHGYAIKNNSLKNTSLKAWFMNANDKTVEGVKHQNKPVFAVQWHPEAAPGPYDTEFLFDTFLKLMEAN